MYGVPYNTDGLANLPIDSGDWSIRFRAVHTGTFAAIKNFWIFSTVADGTGPYGAGTGGHVVVELRTDDGTANHFPTSTVLSTYDMPSPMNRDPNPPVYATSFINGHNTWNFWEIPMPSASITADTLYHIVYRNIDGSPNANYVSLDCQYNAANVANMQPGITDTDLSALRNSGGWSPENDVTPIYQVNYTDGFKQGFGYQGTSAGAPTSIWGVNKVRTLFTPGRRVTVQAVKVRLRRVGTPGALTVSLKDGGGSTIESGTVSGVPTTDTWVLYTFTTPRVLSAATQYQLELSTTGDASNRYQIFGFLDGAWAHFSTSPFPEGWAQIDSGSGYADAFPGSGGIQSGADWQLYFEEAPTLQTVSSPQRW